MMCFVDSPIAVSRKLQASSLWLVAFGLELTLNRRPSK